MEGLGAKSTQNGKLQGSLHVFVFRQLGGLTSQFSKQFLYIVL